MPLKQRLTNSSIAKAVFLLTLVVVASWLGRLLSLGSGVHSVAGHEGSHPAAQACEKKISTPGADAETEQTLPKVVSKTLAARLSTAVLMPRSSQQQKLGGPPGGLPLELARGHVVEKRDSAPDGKGRSRRATIFRTDFKYPFLRLEQEIVNDPSGGEIVTAQLVMVADHLLVKLQEGFTETELSIHIASMGAKILRHLPNSPFYTVVLNRATVAEFDKALSALEVAPGPLAYAEPDFISIGGSAPVYPNDPSFAL
ncbi:MAG: hypothetical protein WCN98_13780, partial [Verrucomicrobiaceae bacterium]